MVLKIIKRNDEKAKKIEKKLKENNGYCPCALEKSEDTKCMCKDFKLQRTTGPCHCGLYEKIEEDNMPKVSYKHFKKVANVLEKANTRDEDFVTFEFLVGSLFPVALDNIKKELKNQYTLGYMQGQKDMKQNK